MSDRPLHQHKGSDTTPEAHSPPLKPASDQGFRHPLPGTDSMSKFEAGVKTAATSTGLVDRGIDPIDEPQLSNPSSTFVREDWNSRYQPHIHNGFADSLAQLFTHTKEPQRDKTLRSSVSKRSAPLDEPEARNTRARISEAPANNTIIAGYEGPRVSAGFDLEAADRPPSTEKSQNRGKRVETGKIPAIITTAPVTHGGRRVMDLLFHDDPAEFVATEKFLQARKEVIGGRSLIWQMSHLPDDIGPDGPERWVPPFDVTQDSWQERPRAGNGGADNATAPVTQDPRGSTVLDSRATLLLKNFHSYQENFGDIRPRNSVVSKYRARGDKIGDKGSDDDMTLAHHTSVGAAAAARRAAGGSVLISKASYGGSHPGKHVFSAIKTAQPTKITKRTSPTEQPPSLLAPQNNDVESGPKRPASVSDVPITSRTKKNDSPSGTNDATSASGPNSITKERKKHPTYEENQAMLTAYLNNWSYLRMGEDASSRHDYDQTKQHFMYLIRKGRVGPRYEREDGGRRWVTLEWMREFKVPGDWEERDGKAWAARGLLLKK
ncbi:uncharacterized protein N0V89_009960 [Didymosphaeria variabile]|uniref:Uncharacterized protein n=1 Tax=Didymosphaeria variabile TaxID=1932322 RepID=A0A9W9C730_9PLEO|nr:uncharacterized protein N0V89_009960 [Didymosphaeria variabile]KAJ4348582.1 hypothetical protein N0V89_009960 [Didymosphaeria variabile]